VPVVLHATFDVKYGTIHRFEDTMSRFVPAMVAQGWRLLGAYRSITGDVSQAIHVWEIPEAESLLTAPPKALAEFRELLAAVEEFVEIIERESLRLLVPMSYSPELSG
jgi:hypothetical protein